MSTQKKWKLAQMLCLAVMLAGIIGLGVSVFGEAGPHRRPGGPVGNLACVLAQRRRKGK